MFGCVWICLGEKLERESAQKLPKIFLCVYVCKMRGLGVFMDLGMPSEARCTLLVRQVKQGALSQPG